jgi:putative glutamine amidotransferase
VPVYIGITCNYGGFENKLSRAYVRAVAQSGAVPLLLPVSNKPRHWRHQLEAVDGLLLSGGGDPDAWLYGREALPCQGRVQPERDKMEIFMAEKALKKGIPVLGICRGAQILNIAAGGTLHQDLKETARLQHYQQAPRSYPIHTVRIVRPSLLYNIVHREEIRVNSFHHQAVELCAAGAAVSAFATDGVAEAVEFVRHPFALGVQWHPEWLDGKYLHAAALFSSLKDAAQKRRKMRCQQRK